MWPLVCLLKDQFVAASLQDDIRRCNFKAACNVAFSRRSAPLLFFPHWSTQFKGLLLKLYTEYNLVYANSYYRQPISSSFSKLSHAIWCLQSSHTEQSVGACEFQTDGSQALQTYLSHSRKLGGAAMSCTWTLLHPALERRKDNVTKRASEREPEARPGLSGISVSQCHRDMGAESKLDMEWRDWKLRRPDRGFSHSQ